MCVYGDGGFRAELVPTNAKMKPTSLIYRSSIRALGPFQLLKLHKLNALLNWFNSISQFGFLNGAAR